MIYRNDFWTFIISSSMTLRFLSFRLHTLPDESTDRPPRLMYVCVHNDRYHRVIHCNACNENLK